MSDFGDSATPASTAATDSPSGTSGPGGDKSVRVWVDGLRHGPLRPREFSPPS
ncbi:unnamed protein product [Cyprideis torosa]|uniref:Uncharacterized protein n=1 Tax=Cyprideis torosa TaxID=163714 RepID=A0A7R8WU87_9CRUS|nr:unnamed protein product [Cyprideis torosa]CAG0909426.1 unnamed protein product [Cyprideis torosa]